MARVEEKKQKNLESPPSLFGKPEDKENQGKTCKLNKNAKDMTQGHCGPEIRQALLLRMGKVLGTPMRPKESVFLGFSAHCG